MDVSLQKQRITDDLFYPNIKVKTRRYFFKRKGGQ